MEFKRCILLLFIFFLNLNSGASSHPCEEHQLLSATTAMNNAINYLSRNKQNLVIDVAFVLGMVEAQLSIAINNAKGKPDISPRVLDDLKSLQKLSGKVSKEASISSKANNPEYYKMLAFVTEPGMFNLNYKPRKVNRTLITNDTYDCSFMLEEFNLVKKSDVCIGVLNNYYNDKKEQKDHAICKLSDVCMEYIKNTHMNGYILTHQLIDLQLAEAINCLEDADVSIKSGQLTHLQEFLCANILRDAEILQRMDYAENDLFAEQIAICGMYGYVDFLRQEWFDVLLSWQYHDGSYHSNAASLCIDYSRIPSHKRVKRNEVSLSDGGSAHFTTMVVNAFTSMIRICIDNNMPQDNTISKYHHQIM